MRETPNKKNQRFVEFYDVRNAANAMAAMSGQELYGRKVMIEYSRRGGGQFKKPWKSEAASSNKSSSMYRNPSGSDGSKSSSSGSSSLSNLCIYEECSRPLKKNISKKSDTSSKLRQLSPWKGGARRQGKEHDPRFLINEDAIVETNCRDLRTTVMIKNIPNKYRYWYWY